MGLEVFGFIADLVAANPLGSDGKNQGDDHIRGVKSTLLAQFPNFTGEEVTPTEAELNDAVARLVGPIDGALYAQRDGAWFAIDGFAEVATNPATVLITTDQFIHVCITTGAAPMVNLTEGAEIGRVIVVENFATTTNDMVVNPGVGEDFIHSQGTGAVTVAYGQAAHFLKVDATTYRVIL